MEGLNDGERGSELGSVVMEPRSHRRGMSRNGNTDSTLLKRVADARDESAFTALFDRHSAAAYSLALHITRDKELAEEAVQEAMIAVWQSAGQFKEGNARSWLLRVVANKGLYLLRNQRRRAAKMSTVKVNSTASAQPSPDASMESADLLASVREQVDQLPQQDQQILALYYGGGLTQKEIARGLNVSQMSISSRITQTLEGLRRRLRVAGYAAPVFVALPNTLSAAFQTGVSAPADLATKLQARIALEGPRSAGTLGSLAGRIAPLAGLAFVGLVGLLAWQLTSQPATTGPHEAVAPQESVIAEYDFSVGVPDAIEVRAGTWTWTPEGLRAPAAGLGGYLSLPVHADGKPFEIIAVAQFIEKNTALTTALSNETALLPRELEVHQTNTDTADLERLHYRATYSGHECIEYLGETYLQTCRYAEDVEIRQVALNAKGVRLERIEIRRAGERRVPVDPSTGKEVKHITYNTTYWRHVPCEPMVLHGSETDRFIRSARGRATLEPFRSVGDPSTRRRWRLKDGQPGASLDVNKSGEKLPVQRQDGPRFKRISGEHNGERYKLTGMRKVPFVLDMAVRRTSAAPSGITCSWAHGEQVTANLAWPFNASKVFGQMTGGSDTFWARFYVIENYIVLIRENVTRSYVLEHRWPYDGDRMIIETDNLRLNQLEYRALGPDDVPDPLRTPRTCIGKPGQNFIYNSPRGYLLGHKRERLNLP